jgi:hypothetical protein
MSRPFDVDNPFWVTPEFAEPRINSGWIGQCSSDTSISRLIRYGTQGAHSHSMMFVRNGGNRLDVLEVREFHGGRRKTFNFHTKQVGQVDVFSPDIERWPEFNPEGAALAMRDMVDYDYGWAGVFQMLLRRTPFLWYLYKTDTIDELPHEQESPRQPFCSHAVSLATHRGGGVDPVPRSPHWLVTPNMLTRSMFFRYEFTLATAWCEMIYGKDIAKQAAVNEETFTK